MAKTEIYGSHCLTSQRLVRLRCWVTAVTGCLVGASALSALLVHFCVAPLLEREAWGRSSLPAHGGVQQR